MVLNHSRDPFPLARDRKVSIRLGNEAIGTWARFETGSDAHTSHKVIESTRNEMLLNVSIPICDAEVVSSVFPRGVNRRLILLAVPA